MKEKTFLYALYLAVAALSIGAVIYLVLSISEPPVQPLAEKEDDDEIVADGTKHQLRVASEKWTGDFSEMLENRRIRVLVPYDLTLYFILNGKEYGIIGETVRDFERHLNKKYARKLHKRPLTVFILPRTRDVMIRQIQQGKGDIAAGDITVTEERLKTVDFVSPMEIPSVSEVLVTGPSSPAINTIEDLTGKTVHVPKSSSYYESLCLLNDRFRREKKEPVKLVFVPDALEDKDLLDMLNAGIFEFLIVDDWLAKIWKQVLPAVRIRENIILRERGSVGWAIRKNSPELEAELRDFYANCLKKRGIAESRVIAYYKGLKKIVDPVRKAEERNRLKTLIELFEKYGEKYRFDWLMLAAQGYQESTLDQRKRSPKGAIGVMQIMPATGAAMRVGDIRVTEPNIHAAAKYMDMLIETYFPDAVFDEQERNLFAFASYNAGPGNIARMRRIARQRGLNPNKWFNHVELVTAEKIGFQTTTYVRNIYKYYIAYKLATRGIEKKKALREQIKDGRS